MTAERDDRGTWRGVYAALVEHEDFVLLTPHARLTLFVIRLGTSNTIASIFRWHAEVLQEQTGLDAEALEAALRELERKPSVRRPWILRDDRVLWVRNGLRFDPTVVLSNENHLKAVRRVLSALPASSSVVRRFRKQYAQIGLGGPSHSPGRSPRDPLVDNVNVDLTSPKTGTRTNPVTGHPGVSLAHGGNGSGPTTDENHICPVCYHAWAVGPDCPRAREHKTRRGPAPGTVGDALPGALRGMGR